MVRTLEELEAIIREKICAVCSDRKQNGECGLEDPSTCALFRLFPNVVRAIQSTDSSDIRDYVAAIRENVCSCCGGQDQDGTCEKRRQVECALDAYLLLIVDVIEEATGKQLDTAALSRGGSVALNVT